MNMIIDNLIHHWHFFVAYFLRFDCCFVITLNPKVVLFSGQIIHQQDRTQKSQKRIKTDVTDTIKEENKTEQISNGKSYI